MRINGLSEGLFRGSLAHWLEVHMQVRQSKQRDQYRPILRQHLDDLPQFHHLSPDERIAMMAVSAVLPFRTNAYVIEELIDWDNIPDDPIYQLTFPQKGMLTEEDFDWMVDLINRDAANSELNEAANDIRLRLNPHPAGQIEHNVPHYGGEPVSGMQHKYWDTALFSHVRARRATHSAHTVSAGHSSLE